MPTKEKIYQDVISGRCDHNIKFNDLIRLVKALGFKDHIEGDHHVRRRDDTPIINLQPKGGKAKAYQVKQVRELIVSNKLEV